MSYTKVVNSNDNECFNGQYNENPDNKEFVRLRNILSDADYRDYVIADMCDIASSTFSKIKLGYYKPTNVQLTALRYAVKTKGFKVKVDSKTSQQPVDNTACTRDGNAYVLSPVTQDESIKPTNSEPTVVKQVKSTTGTGNAIVINVPANFSGSITINVK